MDFASQAAVHYMPRPSPEFLVEHGLEEPKMYAEGVEFIGYMDLVIPPTPGRAEGTSPEGLSIPPTPGRADVHIWDYKTTSNLKYAKTAEELRTDVQLGVYGAWARMRYPDAEILRLSQLYLLTGLAVADIVAEHRLEDGDIYAKAEGKGRRWTRVGRIVTIETSWDDVMATWSSVVETVGQMRADAALPSGGSCAKVIPALRNENHCGAFGGCPFWSNCFSLAERMAKAGME